MEEKKKLAGGKRKLIFAALIFAAALVLVLLVNFFVKTCIVSVVDIQGSSMEPTMNHGEKWLVSKYDKSYERGDVVTFYSNDSESGKKAMISRIVAVSGDTVYIDFLSGVVYINGEPAEEPYAAEKTYTRGKYIDMLSSQDAYSADRPIVVEEGCVFVMGDNRNNSRDSREFGQISVGFVTGVVTGKV